jgi:hypothetical protein
MHEWTHAELVWRRHTLGTLIHRAMTRENRLAQRRQCSCRSCSLRRPLIPGRRRLEPCNSPAASDAPPAQSSTAALAISGAAPPTSTDRAPDALQHAQKTLCFSAQCSCPCHRAPTQLAVTKPPTAATMAAPGPLPAAAVAAVPRADEKAADRKSLDKLAGERAADRKNVEKLAGERAADRKNVEKLAGEGAADRKSLDTRAGERAEGIYSSLLNQVLAVGERLLREGQLMPNDLTGSKGQPWLEHGLVRYVLLEAARRSVDVPGIRLAFAGGSSAQGLITEKNCPTEHRRLFDVLVALKHQLAKAAGASGQDAAKGAGLLLSRALYGVHAQEEWQRFLDGRSPWALDAWKAALATCAAIAAKIVAQPIWSKQWPTVLGILRGRKTLPHVPAKPETAIWESVLNKAFEVGEQALADKLITIEEVRDEEPYLYLGLIGASVLDALRRSLKAKAEDGIELASGRMITMATCPPDLEPLMKVLVALKRSLLNADFTENEFGALRKAVLWAQAEGKPESMAGIAADRAVLVNRTAAAIQSVTSQVTQLPVFKDKFGHVLKLLASAQP